MKVDAAQLRLIADFIDAVTRGLELRGYTVVQPEYEQAVVVEFSIPGCRVPAYVTASGREIRMNTGNVNDLVNARIRSAERTAWQQAA